MPSGEVPLASLQRAVPRHGGPLPLPVAGDPVAAAQATRSSSAAEWTAAGDVGEHRAEQGGPPQRLQPLDPRLQAVRGGATAAGPPPRAAHGCPSAVASYAAQSSTAGSSRATWRPAPRGAAADRAAAGCGRTRRRARVSGRRSSTHTVTISRSQERSPRHEAAVRLPSIARGPRGARRPSGAGRPRGARARRDDAGGGQSPASGRAPGCGPGPSQDRAQRAGAARRGRAAAPGGRPERCVTWPPWDVVAAHRRGARPSATGLPGRGRVVGLWTRGGASVDPRPARGGGHSR